MPFLSPRRVAGATLVAAFAAATAIHVLGPQPPAWYPPCLIHHFTGLHCPGCGSGRALHALAQGDVITALDQNPFSTAFVPLLGIWLALLVWRGLRDNLPPLAAPAGAARVMLVVTILFTIARNLPWWPFTVLAPQ